MADNKTIQKIFSLSDYRKKQLVGEIVERTRETYREYGYFGGGGTPGGSFSAIERIDYSNDTVNAISRGSLTIIRPGLANNTVSNFNFGYFAGGGSGGGSFSSIDRLNYSNDSSNTLSRGFLSRSKLIFGSSGNINFGYFAGGLSIPYAILSSVDRIDYNNDTTTASIKGPLNAARMYLAATGNSNFGYFGGGSPITSRISRLNYSNDNIITSVRGPLGVSVFKFTATGNSNFGYFGGSSSRVDRINYSNDTVTSSVRGPLSSARSDLTGTGNSNFGYFAGGNPGVSPNISSVIDRIDYSNDIVTASVRGPLSTSRRELAGCSSASFGGTPNSSFASNFTFPTVPNAGYFGGGSDATNEFASIDKVDYANDTATASVRSALSSARYSLAATGNGSYGYYAGGRPTPTSPDVSTIGRIEYSSDTQNAVVRSTLNNAVRLLAAAGNSNFGYFGGGFPTRNGVDRLDYSSDTTATSPRQGLPLATYSLAATGNKNFGYFMGGLTASPTTHRSEIYRVDYSNDLTIPQNRGPLSEAKREGVATGDDNFGYFGGAQNPGLSPSLRTQIERLDYSNDTLITSVRSILTSQRFNIGASGNSNFGYFGSGTNGPSYFSTIDRINYSNDTAIAQVRGPLPVAKSKLAATSPLAYGGAPIYFTNPLPQVFQDQIEFDDSNTLDLPFKRVLGSYGYFGGGSPGPISTVDRVDYSNDTATASVRGPLSSASYRLAATGNSNFGYFGGGFPGPTSRVDRIDYSNDSSTASVRGPLSLKRYDFEATGNSNFGYFGGGNSGIPSSRVDRIDYSNDSSTASVRGPLSLGRFWLSATGNFNFGYFGGGRVGPTPISTVDRVDYSNDIATTSIRHSFSLTRFASASTGNSNFGYFGGGYTTPIVSRVDRIDYSNDTAVALVRGPLSLAKAYLAATGNSNFGYFGDGFPTQTSTVDRIDYSNDTATASVRGTLSLARLRYAATTNARNS